MIAHRLARLQHRAGGAPVQGRFAPAAPVAFGILEPVPPPARRELYGRDGGTGTSTEQRNIDGVGSVSRFRIRHLTGIV